MNINLKKLFIITLLTINLVNTSISNIQAGEVKKILNYIDNSLSIDLTKFIADISEMRKTNDITQYIKKLLRIKNYLSNSLKNLEINSIPQAEIQLSRVAELHAQRPLYIETPDYKNTIDNINSLANQHAKQKEMFKIVEKEIFIAKRNKNILEIAIKTGKIVIPIIVTALTIYGIVHYINAIPTEQSPKVISIDLHSTEIKNAIINAEKSCNASLLKEKTLHITNQTKLIQQHVQELAQAYKTGNETLSQLQNTKDLLANTQQKLTSCHTKSCPTALQHLWQLASAPFSATSRQALAEKN